MYDLVFGYEAGDPAAARLQRRGRAGAGHPDAVRLQGRHLLAPAGRDGRGRVRPALPGTVRAAASSSASSTVSTRSGWPMAVTRSGRSCSAAGRAASRHRPVPAPGGGQRPPLLARPPDHSQIELPDAGDLESHHAPRADTGHGGAARRRRLRRGGPRRVGGDDPPRLPRDRGHRPALGGDGRPTGHGGHPVVPGVARRRRGPARLARASRRDAERVRRPVRHVGIDGALAPPGAVGAGGRPRRPRLLLRVDGRAAGHRRRARRP